MNRAGVVGIVSHDFTLVIDGEDSGPRRSLRVQRSRDRSIGGAFIAMEDAAAVRGGAANPALVVAAPRVADLGVGRIWRVERRDGSIDPRKAVRHASAVVI